MVLGQKIPCRAHDHALDMCAKLGGRKMTAYKQARRAADASA